MAINVIVPYNGGFLPDILLLNQVPIVVWFDGIIIVYVRGSLPREVAQAVEVPMTLEATELGRVM